MSDGSTTTSMAMGSVEAVRLVSLASDDGGVGFEIPKAKIYLRLYGSRHR